MDERAFNIEQSVTEFHWWFVVRRKLILQLLETIPLAPEHLALDVGCGIGSNLPVFESLRLNAVGLDRFFFPLHLAAKRFQFPLINGDLEKLPFKVASLDLIVATDVFEHLKDDLNGLRECYQALKKGGILLLTVPAFPFLWGTQDHVTGHQRRYRLPEIGSLLETAGFHMLKSSYFNFFLFLPILMARYTIRQLGFRLESENKMNSPLINFILKTIFSVEPPLLKYVTFPFGVSILCVAQK